MRPKEKAIELVDIYKEITTTWIFKDTITTSVINYDLAKQCALIAVDEVLKILEHSIPEKHTIYWQEVQKEIELL